ncbi:MAG: xanthine dehydrogenase family protein subunit M [Acidimicrobiia bacterium]
MIKEYHRPSSLDEAMRLVSQPATVPLGGGTSFTGAPEAGPVAVVDLQSVGLSGIEADGATIVMGAMTRLQDVVDSPLVPVTIRDLVRREAPNTIRNAATLGGTIVTADSESELLAGLLAFEATVTVARQEGSIEYSLEDVLSDSGLFDRGIITAVSIAEGGQASTHRTSRTPADRPIVAVVARRSDNGDIRIAASGVGARPTVIDADHLDMLTPPGDFRGSSEYRARLITVLTRRALDELAQGSVE